LAEMERFDEAVQCSNVVLHTYAGLAHSGASYELVCNYAISVMNRGWAVINLGRYYEGHKCHQKALEVYRELQANGCRNMAPSIGRALYNLSEGYIRGRR